MPVLKNQRWERFALGLAEGKTGDQAYSDAGYEPNRKNASRLKTTEVVSARVMELQGKNQSRVILSRQYVVDALIENAEKALGRKPVKIGVNGDARETYVYRGDVANAAIRLAGMEFGMFVERKEIKHTSDLAKLSDTELLEVLVKEAEEAQLLLVDHSQDIGPDDVT